MAATILKQSLLSRSMKNRSVARERGVVGVRHVAVGLKGMRPPPLSRSLRGDLALARVVSGGDGRATRSERASAVLARARGETGHVSALRWD